MKKVAILIGSISDKDVVMAAKPYFEYFVNFEFIF